MDNYVKEVENAIKTNKNKRFANSSLFHAKVLIKNLIKNANNKIYILSSNFHEDFYKSLKSNIEEFLKKEGTILKIIVSEKSNNLLLELSEKYKDKLFIKNINKELLPTDDTSQEKINYIVNDTNGFRYEYSDKDIGKGSIEAIANFNSPEESKIITDNFCKLFA